MKLDNLMLDLTKKNGGVFGNTTAAMYTIEFQKRGLPHAHILLFMEKGSKFNTTDDIDRIICAEIPDKSTDPELYQVIADMMMHGPCGKANPSNVCMVNSQCSKNFPKPNNEKTAMDVNGFPAYRHRIDNRFVEKNGHKLDNRFVHVHPSSEDKYFLRVLLNYVKGPTCYEDIKTFENIQYETFKEACEARGLLEDDKQYIIAISESSLWASSKSLRKILKLTKNMRLLAGLSENEAAELKEFSEWILKFGDGKINVPNDGEIEIDIPEDLLIKECGDLIETIVREIYGDFFGRSGYDKFYNNRAILAPTNDDVDQINDYMLSKFPGQEKVYLSCDSIEPGDVDTTENIVYPTEFLNSIKISGLPKHRLKLKIGAPVMCLRNIDPKGGLCNGTRITITQLGRHVVEGRIITGNDKVIGQKVLIPRIYVTHRKQGFPLECVEDGFH